MLDEYTDKDGTHKFFDENRRRNNAYYNAIYDYMFCVIRKILPDAPVIDCLSGYTADAGHKWGLSPVHYQPQYYQEAMTRLIEILAGI